jgi:hypothetical protein
VIWCAKGRPRRRPGVRQQGREARLPLDQRQRAHVFVVEMEEVEDKIHQSGGITGIRRGPDHAE